MNAKVKELLLSKSIIDAFLVALGNLRLLVERVLSLHLFVGQKVFVFILFNIFRLNGFEVPERQRLDFNIVQLI